MDKCPYCSAETRPGDNFCLNCRNRLVPSTPSPQQAQPVFGDATIPTSEDWISPVPETSPSVIDKCPYCGAETRLGDNFCLNCGHRLVPSTSSAAVPLAHDILDKVEHPAQLILRTDTGEVLQEYSLDKFETSIGRAPTSDIFLSKEKLTSRRHATVSYENGNYSIRDERSANGTFVNGQQLEEMTPRTLQDGDHIGIGEHELVFLASQSASSGVDIESMPTITVSPSAVADITYRTREDELLTEAMQPGSRAPADVSELARNFKRYEHHLAYFTCAKTPDPATAIDDRDLDLPVPLRLAEIQTDEGKLKTFMNKNLDTYDTYQRRLAAYPDNGLHAFYTARHCFAVRYSQRALGLPERQLLPWPERLQGLLAQVQHPDLQQLVKEDMNLTSSTSKSVLATWDIRSWKTMDFANGCPT